MLSVLEQLERDYTETAPAASRHVSEAQRQGIVDLVHDLPAVWQAETTTHTERKHVVRLLIKDVMVTKLEKTVRVMCAGKPRPGVPWKWHGPHRRM